METNNSQQNQSNFRRNMIEFIMFFTYAMFAILWIAGSGFTKQIMEYFGITSFSSATFISNAITLAKIVGNLCAASILIKLNPKKAIGFASACIFIGSALATFAPSYMIFVICRFIMGFGGALYVVYFSPMVVNYYEPKDRILMNGLNGSAYNTGSILAMFLVTPIFTWISGLGISMLPWKATMLLFSLVAGVLFVLWVMFGEDFEIKSNRGNQSSESQKEYTFKQALKEPFNYIFPFAYSGVIALYIVVLTIYPTLEGAVINPKVLSAILALSGVVGAILGIVIAKRLTKRLPIIRYSGLLMSVFAYLLFTTTNEFLAITSATMVGFFMFLPNSSMLMLPQELPNMTPTKITIIMGIFFSFVYMIQTVQYFICGIIIDNSSLNTALTFTAIFSLTYFAGSFLLPETGKPKEQQ